MTKKVINTGTAANSKNGDSLRTSFTKINENFTELYTALGLNDTTLNLGAFEFNGSILSTTDSTPIVVDQATTITSDLTVGGDILPSINLGGNLGSPTRQFKSLYVSTNTIYINNVPLSLDSSNNILVNNTPISSSIEYTSIPNAPQDVADLTDLTGLLAGGGGDTGVVRFETNTIYTAAGQNLILNPSNDELNKIVIPGAGNGGDFPLSLTNSEGNVVVNANTAQWIFGTDGTTKFPYDALQTQQDTRFYIDAHDIGEEFAYVAIRNFNDITEEINSQITVQTTGVEISTMGVPSGVSAVTGSSGSWEMNPMSDLATTGGTGTGLRVNVTQEGGYAGTITIQTAGTGYTNGDTITVTSGSSNATFTIIVVPNRWTFSKNGRTTFPNGTVPEHSYGAAGDLEGMVVFTDPYIYYCKQDYVDNSTDIWVRVAWTGTNW